ncbi:MAG: HAD hydrolase family protein [Alphaproteobacteria bacterium]|nr:HAD hydrolase family protein [Alphaproteobacteria bacterium]
MIEINVPGFGNLQLLHLVLDYNGTIAFDGVLLPGVSEALGTLAQDIQIHVITADTFGVAAAQLAALPVELTVIPVEFQAEAKLSFVSRLGVDSVVAFGNGRNDCKMLEAVAVGIALVQKECASAEAVASADVVSTSILDALELLCNPKRLIATLRS